MSVDTVIAGGTVVTASSTFDAAVAIDDHISVDSYRTATSAAALGGVTILMIEQNVKTGVKYADHVFVLENGATRFDGDAETILERPEIREAYLKTERV